MVSRSMDTGRLNKSMVSLDFVYEFSQFAGTLRYSRVDCVAPNCTKPNVCTFAQMYKCGPFWFRYMSPNSQFQWTNSERIAYQPTRQFFKFDTFKDIYVFVGDTMPICEERVRFSTYFWEGTVNLHEMCMKFMHQQKCSLIHFEVIDSKHRWVEFNSTLTCYGLRGEVHHMSSGNDPDWVKVYHSTRVVWTTAGEFMYIIRKGRYIWVSSSILLYGMGIFDGELRGIKFSDYTVSYIPLNYFAMADASSLDDLIKKVDFYLASFTTVGGNYDCIRQKTAFAGLKILSDDHTTRFYIGKSRARCITVKSEETLETDVYRSIHLDIALFNDDRRWYQKFADDVLDSLFNMFERTFDLSFSYIVKLFKRINIGDTLLFILYYMLLFRMLGFVPAAFVSLVLFTITLQWGQLEPGGE